ncbi:gp179 [Bacillus phage W.Ph.]|uniref:Gp179 n=1 Tax=Bacillus phage W.Ph. TaxID=764595 RepID=G9B1T0_9CAUD|nr:gp179 [Bacillus phage W.Ph.]ADH03325.1 gp179 [Bacillus phage W.Ph.]
MCQVLSFTNFKARGEKIDDRYTYYCGNPYCEATAYQGKPTVCPECGCNLVIETFVENGDFAENSIIL